MSKKNKLPIRVLLVDDESTLLRSLARVLTDYDLEVETTTCAAEASVFLQSYPFDVVICDQNMPGKSGLEFLTEVRNEKPELIAMMLSGQIQGIAVAENWAREIGVAEVFAKPCDANVIATRIKKAVAQRREATA